jgi:two-component system phosphate regulon response regulator PhoB
MGDHHPTERRRAGETGQYPAAGRVLLAIGDAAFADLYRETLESVGWYVEVANDWRSAEERLLKSRPDVLVLNTLRDLKQTDALERVRRRPSTRDLPVILLTDTLEPGDVERAKELGVLELLIKSRATRETLSKTLRRVLLENRTEPANNRGASYGRRSTDSA